MQKKWWGSGAPYLFLAFKVLRLNWEVDPILLSPRSYFGAVGWKLGKMYFSILDPPSSAIQIKIPALPHRDVVKVIEARHWDSQILCKGV